MKLRFSIAHFSVKQPQTFKNSFCPSAAQRQTASRCLANFFVLLPQTLKKSLWLSYLSVARKSWLCSARLRRVSVSRRTAAVVRNRRESRITTIISLNNKLQDIEKRFAACAAGKGRSCFEGLRCSRRSVRLRAHFIPDSTDSRDAPKVAGYGLQLREKQKVKRTYGLLSASSAVTFQKALRIKGPTRENLIITLERAWTM